MFVPFEVNKNKGKCGSSECNWQYIVDRYRARVKWKKIEHMGVEMLQWEWWWNNVSGVNCSILIHFWRTWQDSVFALQFYFDIIGSSHVWLKTFYVSKSFDLVCALILIHQKSGFFFLTDFFF